MIYLNCFYRIGNEVLYISELRETDGTACYLGYRCDQYSAMSNTASLLYCQYVPAGKTVIIEEEKLIDAELMNQCCLECVYCFCFCQNSPPIPLSKHKCEEKCKTLICFLRAGMLQDPYPEMIPGCDYQCPSFPSRANVIPTKWDIKEYLRSLSLKKGCYRIQSESHFLMPNVMAALAAMIAPDDWVYLGTGESLINGKRRIHDTAADYLDCAGKDKHCVRIKGKELTRKLYCDLQAEHNPIDYCVICIPALELGIYTNDESSGTGLGNGHTVYAAKELSDLIARLEKYEAENAPNMDSVFSRTIITPKDILAYKNGKA